MKLKSIDKRRRKSKSKSKDETPKLPKQFYDDGLGEILDWIDTEILSQSEAKKLKSREDNDDDKSIKKRRKESKLYGDNEIDPDPLKAPRRVKIKLTDDDAPAVKIEKSVDDRTRGLVNRLAAQTMPFVTSEFEKMYSTNPRQSINAALFNCIENSIIISSTLAKRKLVAELMLLVSYLSHSISDDIGASIVHRLIKKFEEVYNIDPDPSDMSSAYSEDSDKRGENIICCLINLYVIGLVSANVIFELAKRINDGFFRPKSVELLSFLLKSVGFQLRKEASLMRQLILRGQENCKNLEKVCGLDSRVKFMIEAMNAIRNNNVNKLENYGCDIDTSTIQMTLKSLIKKTRLPASLNDATYEEILNSSNWYLLETRVDGNDEPEKGDNKKKDAIQTVVKTNELENKICRALKLNKPAEKTIFCALSKASDYIEACNIIIGFGLNSCSDAMLVCIHAAIYEKKYNPFYFNVINNLSKHNRRYKMGAKFAIQDKIRTLDGLNNIRVDIFKRLCFELVKAGAIPITILKSVEWANLNSSTKNYLVYMFENISELDDNVRRSIMVKVEKKSSFAAAMRTFCNCFVKGCQIFK